MKFAKLPQFLALLGIAAMVSPALAQGAPEGSDGKMLFAHGTGEHKGMTLTDDQKAKLKELKNQFTLDIASKKALLKVQRSQLSDLMKADKVDKSAVLALHAKNTALKNELGDLRMKFLLAANDVFTPEQKSQMREFRGRGGCGGGGCGRGRGGFGHHRHFGKGPGGAIGNSAPAGGAST